MIPAVTGLHQVSQDAVTGATVFAWNVVAEADTYAVAVDGLTVASVPASASPTVTISGATAGGHTLGVKPVASATAPTSLAFTVPANVPGVPTGLTADAVSSTEVDLACATDPGATSYIWSRNGAVLATTPLPAYRDTSALALTTYAYTVAGANATGPSSGTAPVSVTTPPNSGAPATPTGLTVVQGGTSAAPTAVITANPSVGATTYRIQRNGVFLIGDLPTPSYVDATVVDGQTYAYAINCHDAGGASPFTVPVSITISGSGGTAPPTPSGLSASNVTTDTLTLTANPSAGATNYTFFDGGVALTPSPTSPTINVIGLIPGSIHQFSVAAGDAAGESAQSAAISVTMGSGGTAPATPTGLAASATTSTSVTLAANPSTGASDYTFFENGIAMTPNPATPAITASGLTPSTTYLFTIAAGNASGESAQSAAISVTTKAATGTAPPTPTGLAASAVTSDSLELDANPSTGATNYTFFEGATPLTPSPATPALSVIGLAPATNYKFAIAAGNAAGESAESAQISVTTLPASVGAFLSDLVIIMEENEPESSIIGSSSAPYLNSLLPHGALAGPLNTCHPSQPNYIAAIGGSAYGCNSDSPQPWPGVPATARTLVDLLEAKGIPWKALMESLGGSLYAVKHDPFVQFKTITSVPARMANHIAYSDAFWSTWEGGYVWVSPNLTDDGHTPGGQAGVKNMDNWLARVVPLILASPAFTRAGSKAALNISTDESEGSGGNGCVYPGYTPGFMSFWIGPGVKAGYKATGTYQSHYSELATIEAGFGLPNLGQLDATAPVMRELFP
jgi:hypothetical protein